MTQLGFVPVSEHAIIIQQASIICFFQNSTNSFFKPCVFTIQHDTLNIISYIYTCSSHPSFPTDPTTTTHAYTLAHTHIHPRTHTHTNSNRC